MIAAALLGLVATFKRRRRESFAAHWTALSAIFVYLSMDELIGFHELVGGRIHDETPTHGLFYYAATIFTLPMVLLVGFSFLRFVGHLPRATRMLFVGAAALYVAGARGLEMVGGMVDERYGTEGLLYVPQHAGGGVRDVRCGALRLRAPPLPGYHPAPAPPADIPPSGVSVLARKMQPARAGSVTG